MHEKIRNEIVSQFQFEGTFIYAEPFGCGHINSTYAVYFSRETKAPIRYILQAVNTSIFTDPYGLMENIEGVTGHLRKKIIENGGNPLRETLTVVLTKDGTSLYKDSDGTYWRAYLFIEDATCYQTVERPILFTNAAKAFGHFQKLLSDYPAEMLHETIPNFHNTRSRYADFEKAVKEDLACRASLVSEEIQFFMDRREDGNTVVDAIANGKVQLIVNTPSGKESVYDDSYIRKAAIKGKIPYMTTMAAAMATAEGIRKVKEKSGKLEVKSLQQLHSEIETAE